MYREDAIEALKAIYREIRLKLRAHSELMKQAERANWDATLLREADARMDEARALQEQSENQLRALEATLSEEERLALRTVEEAGKTTLTPDAASRLWSKDLAPSHIHPTTALSIEDTIAAGLEQVLAYFPVDWLHEQVELRKSLGNDHLRRPLLLYGHCRSDGFRMPLGQFGYGLLLALDHASNSENYDIYEGARLLPQVAALCSAVPSLRTVKRGIVKLRELAFAADEEIQGRIFELLVAARCAALGRNVEFLETNAAKTPDLRIHDFSFPAVVECKRQRILSAYETREIGKIQVVFNTLCADRLAKGLVGDMRITFRVDLDAVGVDDILGAIHGCVRGIDPYARLETAWGIVEFSPLEVRSLLERQTLLYSPYFLGQAFGWDPYADDFDGICAVVANDESMRIGRIELPFSVRWRVDSQGAIERKARSVIGTLAEAVAQIPVGEGGFVYICYDDFHRPQVADRRTQRILELTKGFEIRRRGIRPPLMIVVGRLFSRALEDGRPDLIESNLPMTTEEENAWNGIMPGLIFTYPS